VFFWHLAILFAQWGMLYLKLSCIADCTACVQAIYAVDVVFMFVNNTMAQSVCVSLKAYCEYY